MLVRKKKVHMKYFFKKKKQPGFGSEGLCFGLGLITEGVE